MRYIEVTHLRKLERYNRYIHVHPLYIRRNLFVKLVDVSVFGEFRLLLAIKSIRPKSTVIRAYSMSNQKSRKWINWRLLHAKLYFTVHKTAHNFHSAYAFFILIWHIFHVTLCSLTIHTHTQTYWGIQPLPLPSFMPWTFFLSFGRSFFLPFFGQFTILWKRTHGIYFLVCLYFQIEWNIYRSDVIRYDGNRSVFTGNNFNVNIYLTCQTCEINPMEIVAQNTQHTHTRALSLGNRGRKKPLTHTHTRSETEHYRAAKG